MMADKFPERRQFSRVPFDAEVTLRQGESSFQAQLVDISLNGFLITTPPDYRINTDRPCNFDIRLANDIVIEMQAALVHSSSDLLGFHCTSIDMESMTHLRRLVEVNLPELGAAERVLAEMLNRQAQ